MTNTEWYNDSWTHDEKLACLIEFFARFIEMAVEAEELVDFNINVNRPAVKKTPVEMTEEELRSGWAIFRPSSRMTIEFKSIVVLKRG